jgi:hypothetical protein
MRKGIRIAKSNRVGMGKGSGSGYKNLIPGDPRVHSESSRGLKQPQRIASIKLKNKYNPYEQWICDSCGAICDNIDDECPNCGASETEESQ